jgi:hypothetical protein
MGERTHLAMGECDHPSLRYPCAAGRKARRSDGKPSGPFRTTNLPHALPSSAIRQGRCFVWT